MSESITLIKELVDYVEAYHSTSTNLDIKEFSVFLTQQLFEQKAIKVNNLSDKQFEKEDFQNYKTYKEIEFSTLLTDLNRFSKHYIKKAFKNTDIRTLDEFGFLATLLRQKQLLKKDLINQHLLEISSGSEVLKRLQAKGLVQELAYEADKRAKMVSLTPKGVETIMNSFDEMHKVSEIIIGNLTGDELKQSLLILNKLETFHQDIHQTDKMSSLSDIHHKYIAQDEV
ncbi:MAG: winged helix-turn-helix transcriptional regulator [Flavobacteriales bacterium]|nr:winged helix-turn-helix transcriptional regulator [Flavobacteriales bacterium]